MATLNPFALLGEDDSDDPSLLIAIQQKKVATKKPEPVAPAASLGKLPTKPVAPSQAVKDSRSANAPARGGGGGRGGFGRGRGGRGAPGQGRHYENGNPNPNGGYSESSGEDGEKRRTFDRERGSYDGPRVPFRGNRRGGYGNEEGSGESDQPPRRIHERRSGTGRGFENKREGSGRGNWGKPTEDAPAQEEEKGANNENKSPEKQEQEIIPSEEKDIKEVATAENEEKEAEDKEMTLEEYEKILEEKRKALLALKGEERKVAVDKELASMQQLSVKKDNEEIFAKLGSDKDSKRKENAEERVKKSLSINEFLKPAEGEGYYNPGGRGRGRGRGRSRGGGDYPGGGYAASPAFSAPAIDDPGHFPTLGGK